MPLPPAHGPPARGLVAFPQAIDVGRQKVLCWAVTRRYSRSWYHCVLAAPSPQEVPPCPRSTAASSSKPPPRPPPSPSPPPPPRAPPSSPTNASSSPSWACAAAAAT